MSPSVLPLLLAVLLLPWWPAAAGEPPSEDLLRVRYERELLASDSSLGPVVETVNLLPAARFEGADQKEDVVGALDEIRGFLALVNTGITGGGPPLPAEVLRQSLAEARLVKTVLEAFVKSGRPLSASDRESIVQISEDMNLKAASFDALRRGGEQDHRWREARVVVRLRGKEDGAPVSGLRVYWVPRALAGQKEEVREAPSLEADVVLQLPEASYLVWAGTVGNPKPLAPQVRLDVRRQPGDREIGVTLPVPRGGGAR